MKNSLYKKIGVMALFCIAITSYALYSPTVCHGLDFDFSPNIINISSERIGDIRVFTRMSYATYVADGHSMSIYFNNCNVSVPKIRATRDSVGNLILRFSMENLLEVVECLISDDFNKALVVITMDAGNEYSGEDEEAVYINDKKTP